jgi:hypothetical protein
MAARVKAIVNPALITWARDSAGFTVAEAAQKLGLKGAASGNRMWAFGRLSAKSVEPS